MHKSKQPSRYGVKTLGVLGGQILQYTFWRLINILNKLIKNVLLGCVILLKFRYKLTQEEISVVIFY